MTAFEYVKDDPNSPSPVLGWVTPGFEQLALARAEDEQMNSARVILEVHDRGSVLERYVFREPRACVVGSALDCDLRISQRDAHDVSFYHCLFVINPPRIRVRDLISREGTYVNGARIGQSLEDIDLCELHHGTDLKDGDEVRIGQTLIRVAIEQIEENEEFELSYSHHSD